MSLAPLRNAALATVATLGGAAALSVNRMYLPSKTQQIVTALRQDLDAYNANIGGKSVLEVRCLMSKALRLR